MSSQNSDELETPQHVGQSDLLDRGAASTRVVVPDPETFSNVQIPREQRLGDLDLGVEGESQSQIIEDLINRGDQQDQQPETGARVGQQEPMAGDKEDHLDLIQQEPVDADFTDYIWPNSLDIKDQMDGKPQDLDQIVDQPPILDQDIDLYGFKPMVLADSKLQSQEQAVQKSQNPVIQKNFKQTKKKKKVKRKNPGTAEVFGQDETKELQIVPEDDYKLPAETLLMKEQQIEEVKRELGQYQPVKNYNKYAAILKDNKHRLEQLSDDDSIHSDDMQEDANMAKALDDYKKIKEKKDKMRNYMQELYGALAGASKPKKVMQQVKNEEESEEQERKPREYVSKEEYKRRLMAHMTADQCESLGFEPEPLSRPQSAYSTLSKKGYIANPSRPVSGYSTISRHVYMGGEPDKVNFEPLDATAQNQSQIPMLDSHNSQLDVSNISIQKPKKSMDQSRKVKFEQGQDGGNNEDSAYKKGNFQTVRVRPDLEELDDNEDDKLVLSNNYSKNMINGKKKRQKTIDIYERQRRLKDKYRELVRQRMIDEDRQEKLKQIKQGGASELMVLNSFEKQSQRIDFIEYMSKHYSGKDQDTDEEEQIQEVAEADEQSENAEVALSLIDNNATDAILQSKMMRRCPTIRENDVFKMYWDGLILMFAIWNCFLVPLVLFFDEIEEFFQDKFFYEFINFVSIIFFFMDIVLQMNTTYYDSDGEEIEDKKKILKHYVSGIFIIDFVSAIPWEYITKSKWRLLNILKIVRLLKLGDIINKANFDEETKSLLRTGKLVFQLVIVMHIVGCIWHEVCINSNRNDLWIPPLDFVWAGKYDKADYPNGAIYDLYLRDSWHKYFIFLYNAVLFLGGNEMGPRTDLEILVSIALLIFMSIFNAWLFGDMAVQQEMSGRKQAQFQEQIDVANTAMKQMDLPPQFQDEVRQFFIYTQGTKLEQDQLKKFLDQISPSLREKVSILIFGKIMRNNKSFKKVFEEKQIQLAKSMGFEVKMQEIVDMMIHRFQTKLMEPEYLIIEQYDHSDSLYVIAKGACEVTIIDQKKSVQQMPILRPGDFFGEISLIYGCNRTATVKSFKYSTLAMLTKNHYKEILIEFPSLQEELKKHLFKYKDRMKKFQKQSLEKVNYFKGISDDALHEIIYNLDTQKFSKYDVLQKPGDNAEKLFFLLDGVIEIFMMLENDDTGQEFVLEKLFRGSIINYRTFFMEDDGKVYYRFGRNSICAVLDYEKMQKIVVKHQFLMRQFVKFKQQTILADKPYPLDYIMSFSKHLKRDNMDDDEVLEAWQLENLLKNVVIRRLTEIRAIKAKPQLRDMILVYLQKKLEKEERQRVRIKEQVLNLYEHKTFQNFEENDPNFNKIIVHINRVLKITTAQTLAIDSLERKIMNLSKRNQLPQNELITQKQYRQFNKSGGIADGANKDGSSGGLGADDSEKKDIKIGDSNFQKLFPDIQEDAFDSSDEEKEKIKNERLERLGKLAEQNRVKNELEVPETGDGQGSARKEKADAEVESEKGQMQKDQVKSPQEDDLANTDGAQNRILVVEDGDILARYRIPIQNNKVDFDLQLPDDSDSSNFSSDQEKNGMNLVAQPKNETDIGEKKDKDEGQIVEKKSEDPQ